MVTMAQSRLDELMGERASRAKEAAVKEVLTALGVESVDALKTVVTEAKKAADAQKTKEEQLAAQLSVLETAKAEAETRARQAEEAALRTRVDVAVQLEAAKQKFLPEAVSDVVALVDRAKIKVEGDKVIGIEEAVKALAESKKHWLATTGRGTGGTPRPSDTNLGQQQQSGASTGGEPLKSAML